MREVSISFATPLHAALEAAIHALGVEPVRAARPVRAQDPFAIDLPPAYGPTPSVATVSAAAATYLFAEVDLAGVIPAAEALVEARADLPLLGADAAAALDKFAVDAHGFPSRAEREKLYARLFGLGAGATLESSGHHAFLGDLGAVCIELVRMAEGPRTSGALSFACERLLGGLASHAGADLQYRARRIHAMFLRAIAILDMPSVGTFLGVRGLAAVVRAIVAEGAPDLGSAERRGRAGQRIITACGAMRNPPDRSLVDDAATWLAESGALRHEGAVA